MRGHLLLSPLAPRAWSEQHHNPKLLLFCFFKKCSKMQSQFPSIWFRYVLGCSIPRCSFHLSVVALKYHWLYYFQWYLHSYINLNKKPFIPWVFIWAFFQRLCDISFPLSEISTTLASDSKIQPLQSPPLVECCLHSVDFNSLKLPGHSLQIISPAHSTCNILFKKLIIILLDEIKAIQPSTVPSTAIRRVPWKRVWVSPPC